MLLLKLSMRPWRLAPTSQIFSALAVGGLLLFIGFLYWIQSGLRPVLMRLQHEQVITAFLDPAVQPNEEEQLVDSIRNVVGAQSTKELRLVDSKQFVSNIKSQYPEMGKELEELGAELGSVVPRYVTILGLFSDATVEDIRRIQGIESADSSKDRYRQVVAAFSALRWVARLLVIGLCIALFTGLIHLSKTNSHLYKESVSLMKLWGANSALLRGPGLLSGLIVGSVGGLVAAGGWLSMGLWLVRHIRALSPLLKEMPLLPQVFPIGLVFTGAVLGLVAGFFGDLFGDAAMSSSSGRRR